MSLALAQLRDRYGRGYAQLLKWLLDPYAATGVFLIFTAFIVDRGGGSAGVVVACAVIPFQVYLGTIFAALRVVQDRASLLQNLNFRRELLPAAVTATETLGFFAALTLLPIMMAAYSVGPTMALLWLPLAMAVNILLAFSVAYPAVLFGVWYREFIPFVLSAVRVLLFLAPGVVALSEITGRAHDLVKLNPLTGVFEAYRSAVLYGEAPALWQILVPLGFAVVTIAIFAPILNREHPHFAKVI